ncbi:hypothetical protein AAC387_Pa09g1218 [Persea americana]
MGTEPRQYIGPITKATKCRQKKTKRIQRIPAAMGIPFCEGDAAAMGRDAAAMREERRRYDGGEIDALEGPIICPAIRPKHGGVCTLPVNGPFSRAMTMRSGFWGCKGG